MTQTITRPAFKIIGIATETTNQDMQAMRDIGALWQRFSQEDIFQHIPSKQNQDVYEVFTDYTGNFTAPYRTIIGCMVDMAAVAPEGMVEKIIPAQTYLVYLAKGKMPDAIGATWGQIWHDDAQLNRSYLADFDVYGARAQDATDAEVEVFVGVK